MPEAKPVRTCGSCTACCTAVGVEEINKPPQTPCTHCTGKGCRVYSARPLGCQLFYCEWLRGWGSETDHPDQLGIIFDQIDPIPEIPEGRMQIWEIEEGALKKGIVEEMTKKVLGQGHEVLHVSKEGRLRLFTPDGREYAGST